VFCLDVQGTAVVVPGVPGISPTFGNRAQIVQRPGGQKHLSVLLLQGKRGLQFLLGLGQFALVQQIKPTAVTGG
jgi:hypothetical protein